ncbi:UNVERIFIED_CONTAM: hypothetical protein K2H54_017534 [Gekko kuhli]
MAACGSEHGILPTQDWNGSNTNMVPRQFYIKYLITGLDRLNSYNFHLGHYFSLRKDHLQPFEIKFMEVSIPLFSSIKKQYSILAKYKIQRAIPLTNPHLDIFL